MAARVHISCCSEWLPPGDAGSILLLILVGDESGGDFGSVKRREKLTSLDKNKKKIQTEYCELRIEGPRFIKCKNLRGVRAFC